jgi:hypothetical protein
MDDEYGDDSDRSGRIVPAAHVVLRPGCVVVVWRWASRGTYHDSSIPRAGDGGLRG